MRRSKEPVRETGINRRPATTPEEWESQIISDAMALVHERIRNGTASSQEVTHFLKLGSSKEKLEQEKLKLENELVKAKTESIKAQAQAEDQLKQAMQAFARYSGTNVDALNSEEEEEDFDD